MNVDRPAANLVRLTTVLNPIAYVFATSSHGDPKSSRLSISIIADTICLRTSNFTLLYDAPYLEINQGNKTRWMDVVLFLSP